MNRRTAFLALAGLAAGCSAPPEGGELSPEELSRLLEDRRNIFFLDVREPAEIQRLGSIGGYVNIPVNQLERRLHEVPRDRVIVTA